MCRYEKCWRLLLYNSLVALRVSTAARTHLSFSIVCLHFSKSKRKEEKIIYGQRRKNQPWWFNTLEVDVTRRLWKYVTWRWGLEQIVYHGGGCALAATPKGHCLKAPEMAARIHWFLCSSKASPGRCQPGCLNTSIWKVRVGKSGPWDPASGWLECFSVCSEETLCEFLLKLPMLSCLTNIANINNIEVNKYWQIFFLEGYSFFFESLG